MVASVGHTKNYMVGPQDGWVLICDATVTNLNYIRISSYPKTHSFQLYVDTVAPTATTIGIHVSKEEIELANYTNTNASKYWVKVVNPGIDGSGLDGRIRLDVYADGGVLQ